MAKVPTFWLTLWFESYNVNSITKFQCIYFTEIDIDAPNFTRRDHVAWYDVFSTSYLCAVRKLERAHKFAAVAAHLKRREVLKELYGLRVNI